MADDLPPTPPSSPSPSAPSAPLSPLGWAASLVVGARGFLVWLSGSLASIVAIFYATGYLITRAHLSMLGLHGVLDFDHQAVVHEGAKFFLVVWTSAVSNAALPLVVLLEIVVIAVMALRMLLRRRAQRWQRALRNRLPRFTEHEDMRLLAFAALFPVFLWHAEAFILKFQTPLCVADLLYAPSGSAPCPERMRKGADALEKALLRRDEALLDGAFMELVFGLFLSVAIAYLTWRITLPWRWRTLCAAPAYLATALYLILLPMDYGVLQRPITYPRIAFTADEKTTFPMTGPLFLLNQTDKEFVVWDASIRKLFWIPAGTVKRAELDGTYHLFDSRGHPAATHGASQ